MNKFNKLKIDWQEVGLYILEAFVIMVFILGILALINVAGIYLEQS